MTVLFYTPLPPDKTGTANYAKHLLDEIAPYVSDNILVLTSTHIAEKHRRSLPLYGIRHYTEYTPTEDDICVFFSANNIYHFPYMDVVKYCQYCRVITVIHDLSCFGTVLACEERQNGSWGRDLYAFINTQLPETGKMLVDYLKYNPMPLIVQHNIHGQSPYIRHSDFLVTHSRYAALRLILEEDFRESRVKAVYVGRQVDDRHAAELSRNDIHQFQVGLFGWIALSKRPLVALRAYRIFYDSLSALDRAAVCLRFVGQLATSGVDIRDLVDLGDARDSVHLTGYVSESDFLSYLSQTSILLSLRYPSCGESSAPLHKAMQMGIPVVVSDYQAFSELPVRYKVSPFDSAEPYTVASILREEFAIWKAKGFHGSPQISYKDARISEILGHLIREFGQ